MYPPKQIGVIVGVSLITFMIFLDVTIVSSALPTMQHALNAELDQLQWVANAMFLSLSALMVVIGRVGDAMGRRKIVLWGIALFILASTGAACAPSLPWLIAFRLLQGAAGSIIPVAAALLTDHFPHKQHARVLGWFSMINGCGLAVGPLLGGFFVQHMSWRWIFGINLPVGLIALLICLWAVQRRPAASDVARLPWGAMISMVIGISALIVALTEGAARGFSSAPALFLFGVAMAFLICFIRLNARSAAPLINFQLFRHPYAKSALLACVCVAGMLGVILFLVPFYLEGILEKSASQSGMVLLSLSLAYLVTATAMGKFVHWVGLKPALLSMFVLSVVCAIVYLVIDVNTPVVCIFLALILSGVLWSMSTVIPTTALISVVDSSQSGVALGGIWTIWNLSSSIVLTASTLLFNWRAEQSLRKLFDAQQIQLSSFVWDTVRTLIANPPAAAHATANLSGLRHIDFAPLFSMAFMHGFFAAFAELFTLAVFSCFCAVMIMRHADAVRLRDDAVVIA